MVLEELSYLSQINQQSLYKLVRSAIQIKMKDYHGAVRGMSGEFFDKRQRILVNDETLSTIFPKAFWPLVKKYSFRYKVDPYLVLAVMRQESKFNPGAVSKSNAIGLMQLLPTTAKDVAIQIGHRWKGQDDLYNIETNIHMGVYYLSWLSRIFKDDFSLTVMAYNAGIGNVRKWKQRLPKDNMLNQLSSIPFSGDANLS